MSNITDTQRIEKLDKSFCVVHRGVHRVVIEDLEVATCGVGDGEYRGLTLREAIDAWIAADEKHVCEGEVI